MKLLYPDRQDVLAREVIAWTKDWIDNNGGPDAWEGGYPKDQYAAARILEEAGLIARQR